MKKSNSLLIKAIHLFLSCLLIACVSENYLLLKSYPLVQLHNKYLILNKDIRLVDLLGWDNKPNMVSTVHGEEPVPGNENIDYLGRRYVGKDVANPSKRLLFLGCSFAFGTEIADDETFIYKTARRFPQWQFDNYSVPAYGTHQCRHKLEQLLLKPDCPKYDYVFYVFMHEHPNRIAYNYSSYLNNNHELVGISPYADFSWNGKIQYHHFDERFFPYTDTLRLFAFLNNFYAVLKSNHDQELSYKERLYNAVLDDMLSVAKDHELDLSVFVLESSEYAVDKSIIDKGLNVYDAKLQQLNHDPKYHVNNEQIRHPNGLANDYWANRLTVVLNKKRR